MIKKIIIILIIFFGIKIARAQQNWVPVACYLCGNFGVQNMFIDSVHNELILNTYECYQTCSFNYKGVVAYDGSAFHSLDFGVDTQNPNATTGGAGTKACIPYQGKTLFGGLFSAVGTNTLHAEAMALWNGAVWDTFPKHCFKYNPQRTYGDVVMGFLRHNNKLWIYGGFDSLGGVLGKNLYSFDGNTFTPYAIPVSDYNGINKMVVYKNKMIAGGPFYAIPSFTISRLAMFDGNTWASVGNGVLGNLSFVYDLLVYKDTLYIAGSFDKQSGNMGNYIMKWDGNQLTDAGFGGFYGAYNVITSLVEFNNRLFVFGGFDHAADQKAFGVAYYENGKWTVPQDSVANYGFHYGASYKGDLYVGGDFKNINNDTNNRYFAKLRCPDFDAATGCVSGIKKNGLNNLNIKVFPNPAHNKIQIEFEQGIAIDKLSISNTLGQEIYKLLKPVPKQEIDVSLLPAGIYFLKAENKQGQGIFKIAKEV